MDQNRELDGVSTMPDIYPTDQSLCSQFNKCPTGRYRLADGLPGNFSFDKNKSKSKDCPTSP